MTFEYNKRYKIKKSMNGAALTYSQIEHSLIQNENSNMSFNRIA